MRTRLLVLCHANRYRSPLAAAFLSQYSHLDIRSAGFKPGGLRAGKPVRDAAAKLGFNLEDHRSVQINADLVNWASLIVCMNPVQLSKLTETYGTRTQRVLLGTYLDVFVGSIPDLGFINPASPEFARVVDMIKDATENLATCLKGTKSPKSFPLA